MPNLPKIAALDDAQLMLAVLYDLSGVKRQDIAKKLEVEPNVISKALAHPRVREYINEIASHKTADALAVLKTESARLMRKAMSVLEAKLDDGELDAVKLVINNIKPKDEAPMAQDSSITIVMPGVAPKDG